MITRVIIIVKGVGILMPRKRSLTASTGCLSTKRFNIYVYLGCSMIFYVKERQEMKEMQAKLEKELAGIAFASYAFIS
jgi:hypothetical protein